MRKNGEQFTAQVAITSRRDAAGNPIGYLLISKDITEQKTLEEQLRRKNVEHVKVASAPPTQQCSLVGTTALRWQTYSPLSRTTTMSAKATSMSGFASKNSPTLRNATGKYCSSQFMYEMMSPVDLRIPRLTASYLPLSFSIKALRMNV
jgi:hypothetical protein